MSGEPKTLWEMTPREAWEHAWEQAIDTCRVFEEEATAGRLEVVRSIGRQYLDQDAGVPVVARDEAAELKAAVKRFLAAIDARDHFIEREEELPHDEWDIAFRRTGDEIAASVAALRRLAGGENEK